MRNFNYLALLSALVIFGACGDVNKNKIMDENNTKPAIDVQNMDTTAIPGFDFYQFSNGGWLANNPLPDDKTRYGSFDVLSENNKEQIKSLIETAAATKDAPKGSPAQQIGDFYRSGLDTNTINNLRLQPIEAELENLKAIQNKNELIKFIAHQQARGLNSLFYIYSTQDNKDTEQVIAGIWQDGLSLPDRDYYLSDDDRSAQIRKDYMQHLQNMLTLAGHEAETAKQKADKIMQMETQMAKASFTRKENRDPSRTYNKFDAAGLKKLMPAFNWDIYLKTIGYPQIDDFTVAQIQFLENLDKMIANEALEDWKTYFEWKILTGSAQFLSSEFEQEDFEFFNKKLSGQQQMEPRWKRVLATTNRGLGETIGQLYVEKHFPPQAKEKMLALVGNLKKSFNQRIEQLDWMTAPTKEKALEKLETMNVKIGYPNKWKDYSNMEIVPDNYFQNVKNANLFAFNFTMDKIGKPVDRDAWAMYPQTVNAYYSPSMNEIVFPAAILQAPFFDLHADDAVNYGAIGVVIGHEMTHGFDDQGRQYDKNGNLNDWWSEADSEEFKKRTQKLVEQYNDFVAIDDMHLDGELTLGENIADFGGLTIAYQAYQMSLDGKDKPTPIDGFTDDQRFFLSYAGIWRNNVRDEELKRYVKEDVHSPGKFRVNGALFNVPEFYAAFKQITENDPLYRNAEQRPIIW